MTRFLEQATWGPKPSEVAAVQAQGLRAFIDEQFNAPVLNPSKGSDYTDLPTTTDDSTLPEACPTTLETNARNACLRDKYTMYPLQAQFFKNALTRPGQLRQRVAFALHQVFVVSGVDIPLPWWMNGYLQTLDRNALGNYHTLLGEMTLNPAMGEYLNMNQSTAGNPNENYAREVLQLFSTGGTVNHDGTAVLDAQGCPPRLRIGRTDSRSLHGMDFAAGSGWRVTSATRWCRGRHDARRGANIFGTVGPTAHPKHKRST